MKIEDRQTAALLQFAQLIDRRGNLRPRARHLRWNAPFPEPPCHRYWRACALVLSRAKLAVRSGIYIDGEFPSATLRSLQNQECRARRAMEQERAQVLLWAERARARTRMERFMP